MLVVGPRCVRVREQPFDAVAARVVWAEESVSRDLDLVHPTLRPFSGG
ncbi:hypothetical protein [Pseudonocardia sp. DLS-67]